MPERVQRQRKAGQPGMPAGAIYVGRPTRWGNPFIVGREIIPPVNSYQPQPVFVRDAEHAVRLYRNWITGAALRCADVVPDLGGRDLACWCPLDRPCHADVLLQLANGGI